MNEQQVEPRLAEPQVNERLWQEWQWKNRERDKARVRNRLRFLKILLALVFVAALLQSYIERK